jgi:hypothetical protein
MRRRGLLPSLYLCPSRRLVLNILAVVAAGAEA